MTQEKEYFAFISYQRKDEEWADRLRSKLEHYRLPSSVRKQDASLPKEIRPIFRDALELAGGVLAKEIETALQQSKFLIVICSPNSAKSPWVNKEIQTFIDLGREDRIIPFIIDGTPFSGNEDTECFPPALRSLKGEKELLGININELSRDAAAIKVVARMFGLKFDTLWQRYEREEKRKRWLMIGGALLFALVSLGIGTYIAHQNQELDAKNREVITERDRANSERMRAEAVNVSLKQANDSIKKQYAIIEQQKDSISQQKDNISQQKNEIAKERDNVKSANYKMQVTLSRIIAREASALAEEGDSYLARLLALQALPPNKPYNNESELALRLASQHNNGILRGHTDCVNSVNFSSNGKYLVSCSNDNTVRVWEVCSGRCIRTLKGHEGPVYSASFSIDDKRIVSASADRTIRIWDAETGSCKRIINGHQNVIKSVSLSFDGKRILSSSWDNTIRLWDTETGCCLRIINDQLSLFGNATFSPDSKLVVSIHYNDILDNSLCVWDAETGCKLKTMKGHSSNIYYASFSPDGKSIISASGDMTIRIWNTIFGTCNIILEGHTSKINSVSYSPDGNYIVSASDDKSIRLWNKFGRCLRIFEGHTESVCSASFSRDGKMIASASYDKTIRLWDVSRSHEVELKAHIFGYVSFCDGKPIVPAFRSNINDIDIIDVGTGKILKTLKGHESGVLSASISYDGQSVVSTSIDKTIRIWNIVTGHCINRLKTTNIVTSASLSPGGTFVVFESMGKIFIWDGHSDNYSVLFDGYAKFGSMASFSLDGKCILIFDNNSIRFMDMHTGECIKTLLLKDLKKSISSAVFSPNRTAIVTTSYDHMLCVWDAKNGTCLHRKTIENIDLFVTFCPDDKHIMLAFDNGSIELWDFPPLQQLIDENSKRFKNRQLTPEEKVRYNLK